MWGLASLMVRRGFPFRFPNIGLSIVVSAPFEEIESVTDCIKRPENDSSGHNSDFESYFCDRTGLSPKHRKPKHEGGSCDEDPQDRCPGRGDRGPAHGRGDAGAGRPGAWRMGRRRLAS